MPLELKVGDQLPPAVPPYRPDVDRLYRQMGMLQDQVAHVTEALLQRTAELNVWHDRAVQLQAELDALKAPAPAEAG